MTTMTDHDTQHIAELRVVYAEAMRAAAEATNISDAANHAVKRAHLALLIAEGNGSAAEARWIRAWLASDHAACRRILAEMSPRRFAEETSEANEILRTLTVGHVAGIPVTVDVDT